MKKILKIIGITLLSIIGVVALAVTTAAIVITSSGKLTKIVNNYLPQYVDCETHLGKANLTISTFPNIGVEINDVKFINPMTGAPSDTLASIEKLTLATDIKKILKNKEIEVKECILENANINIFSDSIGNTNYNVFGNNNNDKDTTNTSFDYSVDLQCFTIINSALTYIDQASKLSTKLNGLDINIKGNLKDDNIKAAADIKADKLDLGSGKLQVAAANVGLSYNGRIDGYKLIDGNLLLNTPDITLNTDEEILSHDAIKVETPLKLNLNDMTINLDKSEIGLNNFLVTLAGNGKIAPNNDIDIDMRLNTNPIDIEEALNLLPSSMSEPLEGITVSGKLTLSDCSIKGTFNDSLIPTINANIKADDLLCDMEALPYPITNVNMDANLNLDLANTSRLTINNVTANMNKSSIEANGTLDDITDNMVINLYMKAGLPLSDVKTFMPDDLTLNGNSKVSLSLTNTSLDNLLNSLNSLNFNHIYANGIIEVGNLDVTYSDSIKAVSPQLNIGFTTPASRKENGTKGVYMTLKGDELDVKVGESVDAKVQNPDITLRADNFAESYEKLDAKLDLQLSHIDFRLDTINVTANATHFLAETAKDNRNTEGVGIYTHINNEAISAKLGNGYSLKGNRLMLTATLDEDKEQPTNVPLQHWNPTTDFILDNAQLELNVLNDTITIPKVYFMVNKDELSIKECTMRLGRSDLTLEGNVINIAEWVDKTKDLTGEIDLVSSCLDINEIMNMTSGIGVDKDSIAPAPGETIDEDANPFIVPRGIDLTCTVKSKKALYGNFDLNDLGGRLTVRNGKLILEEIGFTNEAAEMQLTAIYESPRINHLFLGMDFHLLNVQINDLLRMIPEVDTLVPMLKTFDGQAEFHITAQTNLNAKYEPKISTLRAAADVEGQNLYVRDTTSFSKITNMLKVSSNGEYRIDSLDVQLTVFRNEIDLYPFLITIGKYKAVASGRHTLDMNCDYHVSVTDTPLPLRLGLDIKGKLDDLNFKLAPCKYKNLYRPSRRSDTDNMVLELKRQIANSLKKTVK